MTISDACDVNTNTDTLGCCQASEGALGEKPRIGTPSSIQYDRVHDLHTV